MAQLVARTHQGLVRLNNEDYVYADPDGRFAILADGMGGLMAGEVASRTAVESARSRLSRWGSRCSAPQDLAEAMQGAHDSVVNRAKKFNYIGKMGTTLIIWAMSDDSDDSFFCHVGDSRLYAYGGRVLKQLTRDHTLAQRLVDEGAISVDDEDYAEHGHVLTRALGLPGLCSPDCGEVPATERLLLCSDGLSDLVSDADIGRVMAMADLERCADDLLKAALDAGGRDNVSVVLVEF